ncbi:hypothetical protein KAR28_05855 [Candidatus Parcubacteria bacterium]|nr:hypothetical protein [Candidatus Parcubacteria bacterium]
MVPCSHFEVVAHKRNNELAWKGGNFNRIKFDRSDVHLIENLSIEKYHEMFGNRQILNINALFYILLNKDVIPENWKMNRMYFLGTVFKYIASDNKQLFMPYLYWRNDEWQYDYRLLGDDGDFKTMILYVG